MADVEMGTVTPFNSLFTFEEAQMAARRMEEAIADRQKELNHIHDFISDNSALIHHVQKLPDELSHDIMVPFGGAAFFPGRLIHTNEFLVLLGEGYYAERSAKQTVEILQRRGKSLEANLESLKRIIKDLEVEAKFFDSTAAEVAEGLVEIREEYVEETRSKKLEAGLSSTNFRNTSKAHNSGIPDEEDEDAKIMARLDELEKEEEVEAASDSGNDEDDEAAIFSDVVEDEDDEAAIFSDVVEDEDDENASYSMVDEEENKDEEDGDDDEKSDEDKYVNDSAGNISETDVKISSSIMEVAPGGSLKSIAKQSHETQPPLMPPETRDYLQQKSSVNNQSSLENRLCSDKMGSTELKAFTGTIIEHSYGLLPDRPPNDSTSSQPSKLVSRFKKMQKDNR